MIVTRKWSESLFKRRLYHAKCEKMENWRKNSQPMHWKWFTQWVLIGKCFGFPIRRISTKLRIYVKLLAKRLAKPIYQKAYRIELIYKVKRKRFWFLFLSEISHTQEKSPKKHQQFHLCSLSLLMTLVQLFASCISFSVSLSDVHFICPVTHICGTTCIVLDSGFKVLFPPQNYCCEYLV